jgi:hypothetical protein
MIKPRLRRIEAILDRCEEPAAGRLPPRSLQTAQDVIDLLEEQVEELRAAPWIGALQKAQVIAVLAGIARKAIETGTLAARLELLEAVLKPRQGEN